MAGKQTVDKWSLIGNRLSGVKTESGNIRTFTVTISKAVDAKAGVVVQTTKRKWYRLGTINKLWEAVSKFPTNYTADTINAWLLTAEVAKEYGGA